MVHEEFFHHQRGALTTLSPRSLRAIRPLGRSRLIEDDGNVIYDAGASGEYLGERLGGGHFVPARGSDDHIRYLEYLHFAEGSVMTPILLNLYVGRLGEAGAPLHPRIDEQLESHFGFMEDRLLPSGWFVGETLTGADFMMSFPAEAAVKSGRAADKPKLTAYVERIHARPQWQAALAKGGPYAFA